MDEATADLMSKLFIECLVAPAYSQDAMAKLMEKQNIRLLTFPEIGGGDGDDNFLAGWGRIPEARMLRSVYGGMLAQTPPDPPFYGIDDDTWTVAGHTFRSRLIVGTGKYQDFAQNAAALEASGAEIVTVAVRRVNVSDPGQPMLTDFIDPKKVTYLPNTAGCFTADEAVRTLRLAREAGGWDLVKLEVLGEAKTLYPDMRETLRATETLANEGFHPMVYCADDPIAAKQLEEAGAVAIMPLGAPIGSGLGIQNRVTIRLIVEGASVPVLVDAGVGTASDAAVGMELGCDGILMNTAIAEAKDPIRMARAMRRAVQAGRDAYLSGRMATRKYADPSSPLAGLI